MILKDEQYTPKLLLTVYESTDKLYVEQTPIKDGIAGASSPLSEDVARGLGKRLYMQQVQMISGTIPENLLRLDWNGDKPVLIWYTLPQRVFALYHKSLGLKNGYIQIPALLWLWDDLNKSLYVKAIATPIGRPDLKKVYHAPFHNVYDNGKVCLGAAGSHIVADNFQALITKAMQVFWDTEFSETHNPKAVKGNLNSLHHDLVTNQSAFPCERLIKTDFFYED